ncbi:hypothetical protein C0991_010849, partial [Blastosporella zonata]
NLAGDTARNAQRRARVVRKRTKRTAASVTRVTRAVDDDEEGPAAGPSQTTLVALPTLGAEDDEGEILGEGILGVPELEEERDDGAPVAPEGAEGDGESESANSVWWPAEKPVTEFKRVTRCERELAALHFELLRLQTTLGETWQLQGALIEARREAEEALWEVSAFE